MDGGIGFGRDNKKTQYIKSYKAQEDEESHGCLPSEMTRYMKNKNRASKYTNLK